MARYTRTQGQYLAFIYYYSKIHGEPPAEADMQRYFKTTPPAVHQMVVTLEKRGLITRVPPAAEAQYPVVVEFDVRGGQRATVHRRLVMPANALADREHTEAIFDLSNSPVGVSYERPRRSRSRRRRQGRQPDREIDGLVPAAYVSPDRTSQCAGAFE